MYDAANRLVQVEDDATQVVIAEYGYDPFGRRLWKEVGGTRTYFLYADEGLVAEYDQFGTERRSYGWQPDSTWGTHPLWLKQDDAYYWYQNDHVGTPQQFIDMNGTVVWLALYTAFGEARVQVEAITNTLRFPGQYFDAETGLHYNFHRYYDPEIGRYTKVDPIGLAGGDVNLYGYVGNAPINGGDPMGLAEPISIAVGFCTAQPQICAAIAAGVTYGACRLMGGCQPLPIGEPFFPPITWFPQHASTQTTAASSSRPFDLDMPDEACPPSPTESQCPPEYHEWLKPIVRDIIDMLVEAERPFKDHKVPGGLAGAIRHQIRTGELVGGKDHLEKGYSIVKRLKRLLKRLQNAYSIPDACKAPIIQLLQSKINDLLNALNTKP